jgi:hypothetical protein
MSSPISFAAMMASGYEISDAPWLFPASRHLTPM